MRRFWKSPPWRPAWIAYLYPERSGNLIAGAAECQLRGRHWVRWRPARPSAPATFMGTCERCGCEITTNLRAPIPAFAVEPSED